MKKYVNSQNYVLIELSNSYLSNIFQKKYIYIYKKTKTLELKKYYNRS